MTPDRRPIAIMYHKGCPDGFGAAWAAWRADLDASYHPVTHRTDLPAMPQDTMIYMLDYAPARAQAERMHERHGQDRVAVIDHHATGARELAGVPNCRFDMQKSGAVMAWEEFHGTQQVPELLRYVEDRDLWNWELPDSREINAYLFALGFDFRKWSTASRALGRTNARAAMIRAGGLILESEQRLIKATAARATMREIAGHLVPCVNSAVVRSAVASLLLNRNAQAPFAVVWYDHGTERNWSLRSRGDFDVETIAAAMGGGGHGASASFKTPIDPTTDPCSQPFEERQ